MVVRTLSKGELSSLIGGSKDCSILWFSWLESFHVVFLKDPSESFMVTKNSRIGQIMRLEQVISRFISLGTHMLSLQQKTLGKKIVVTSSPFRECQSLGQEVFGPLRLSIGC